MNKEYVTLATSQNIEKLAKMIANYFYSDIKLQLNGETQQWDLYNAKGKLENFRVIIENKRAKFQSILL